MMKASLHFLFGFTLCLILIGYGLSYAQEETQSQEQTTTAAAPAAPPTAPTAQAGELPAPLEAEMTVAEHWSKNPYPKTVAAGSRVHVVEKHDTLWDLAKRYYNNPFLWPQIWDANKYIPNAHWIYPGDPIVIPPMTPLTEEKVAEAQTQPTAPEQPPAEAPGPAFPAPEKKGIPIGKDADIYCSGYISQDWDKVGLKIIGNEENIIKVTQSVYDVVYISKGEAEGVSPGDEFTILHKGRSLEHPVNLKPLGDYVLQVGRVKVVATQEHTSTAQVTYSCDAALVGDKLVPFEPKELPLFTDLPPVDRYSVEGPNAKGYIVYAKDDLGTVGTGHEVYIDLGAKDGIQVGTRLVIYRENKHGYEGTGFEKNIPRRVLGEMVVLSVQEHSATGRIIQMYFAMIPGDRVEVR
jgi:LysM domain